MSKNPPGRWCGEAMRAKPRRMRSRQLDFLAEWASAWSPTASTLIAGSRTLEAVMRCANVDVTRFRYSPPIFRSAIYLAGGLIEVAQKGHALI